MNERIKQLTMEVMEAKARLRDAIAGAEPEVVDDWKLRGTGGRSVSLSELFGDQSELLVVHNMGSGCNYCSLWGDAMIGIAKHLRQRCGFALCSNDPPETIEKFQKLRGWDYPCVSGAGSGFAKAMGYATDDGKALPGVSAFHKRPDGTIVRTGDSVFGPGDDFCPLWPMLDLVKGGRGDWEPTHGKVGGCCSGDSASACACS